jgi:hypothetical protein
MGHTRFDSGTYIAYTASVDPKTKKVRSTLAASDYTAKSLDGKYDPKIIKIRESAKSVLNPHPTPLIVGLDVSGSMGRVVEAMRKGLGTLFEEIIKRHPVSDPHVLAMAIGDMDYDSAPVQATQFESDPVVIGPQIEELYLERGGGNNCHESYLGPLYFVLMRTTCDAFKEDPARKGYLFTVGDEETQDILSKRQIEKFFGDQPKKDYTAQELIEAVSRNWHYFHVIVEEGSHASLYPRKVRDSWTNLLGQRVLPLADHTKLAEVIVSAIEVTEGRDKDAVTKSWSGGTDLVVKKAITDLTANPGSGGGLTTGPVAL